MDYNVISLDYKVIRLFSEDKSHRPVRQGVFTVICVQFSIIYLISHRQLDTDRSNTNQILIIARYNMTSATQIQTDCKVQT